MIKRILLSLFFLGAGIFSSWGYNFFAVNEGQTIYYNITDAENHSVEVTYNTISYDSYVGAIVVPQTVTYNDIVYTVTAVGESAFRRSTTYASTGRVTSVTLPNTITSIGDHAFHNGGSYLLSVNIPDNVNNIGEYAFAYCTAITSITIPEAVEEIKTYAFNSCSGLTSITIPDNVETIRSYAFSSCSNVTSITIGAGLKTLESYAFTSCSKLTNLTYNATNVTTVGNSNIWSSPTNNCTLTIGPDVESIPNYVFRGLTKVATLYYNATSSSDYTAGTYGNIWPTFTSPWTLVIGDNVTRIPAYTFRYKSGLQSLTIPSSVTSIGADAFENTSLSQVIIPATVTSIENYAFKNISSLSTVIMMCTTPPKAGSLVFLKNSSTTYSDANMPNIYVLSGNVDENTTIEQAYKSASNWSTWANKISSTIGSDITFTTPVTIPNGGTLDMNTHTLTIGSGGSLTIADGGQLICNNAVQATVQKNVSAAANWGTSSSYTSDGWYFIAAPVNGATFPTGSVADQDIYQLDWAHNIWLNLQNSGNSELLSAGFQRGTGYLYASKDGNTISVAGEIQPLSGSDNATVTLANDGWNLIGNPLTCNVTVDKAFSELNGGSAVTNQTSGSTINPFQGIAVYGNAGTTVTFTKADSQDAVAPSNNSSLQMTLSQTVATRGAASSKVVDNAIVNFNGGSDMPKFKMLEGNANIFIPQNGEDYAIASSNHQGEMPLNFKANEVGTYTISFSGEVKGAYLIDMIDKQEVNLSANPSYTFIGSPADRSERFKIVFRNTSNDIFAYQNGSDIVVTGEGELQIFDVMGRIVSKQYVNGVGTWRAASVQNGVYILKLNGMTQKIVVR